MAKAKEKMARFPQEEDLSIISHGAILCHPRGRILWVGEEKKLSSRFLKTFLQNKTSKKIHEINLDVQTVMPGLIECHTHLGFSGNRAHEFEMRLQGASYQEIYEKGGGIQSTVRASRKVSSAQLDKLVQERAKKFLRQGVTLLEAKSGYGLDLKTELKLLSAYRKILGPKVISTYLGLHAQSPDFASLDEYVDYVVQVVLPKIAQKKLADRVDIFVEKGYFRPEHAMRYFEAAEKLGFQKVIHADQLTLSGGAQVAVAKNCLSADHLLQIGAREVQDLAKSEVTAVLLPAADLYMKCPYPPARTLLSAGARVALATDFNPGSSPTQNINLVGLLARIEMKMTLPEVIVAYTLGAAWALGKAAEQGSLDIGYNADFICSSKNWRELFYNVGDFDFDQIYIGGRRVPV